jgi:hypothetical protein
MKEAIISDSDISGELIYASVFREYKGDIQKFINHIDAGSYNEGFPTIESYITYPDYTELTAALLTLTGVPCTPENSYTTAPTTVTHVQYYLQENKSYSYATNRMPLPSVVIGTTNTSPGSTASTYTHTTTVTIMSAIGNSDTLTTGTQAITATTSASTSTISKHFELTLTDGIATSDAVSGSAYVVTVDTSTIVYNNSPDTYSVNVYDDYDVYTTLPYTIPSKPTGLHYLSYYYRDSAPLISYIFLYKVGTGTYPDLDDPQSAINISASSLRSIPAIPLRLNNVDFTSFTTTKRDKINALCALITIDAEELLVAIRDDPNAPSAGDLDHIYITFGVRLRDVSQAGMSYLFTMCQNLFPTQGITQAIYDATAAGDTKPQNNIIIEADDYKSLFEFSYITYEFTTLAVINANSGSAENGFYYSDLSRFSTLANGTRVLKHTYYVSSAKGTYNVAFKSDTLTEVSNFLGGTGTTNPGTTTTEAASWMQVTTRMPYNNSTPVLQEPSGATSTLEFLTPDLVYENNGSGVLRLVESATEATTAGQSVTYYRAISSGLEAYTIVAPISSLRVTDGETGKFKMVKFNLGSVDELQAPFIHNFIAALPNRDVTQLFLAGAHASVYVAHYEVIIQRTSGFTAILIIIVIVIIAVVAWYAAPAFFTGLNFAAAGTTTGLLAAIGLVPATAITTGLTAAVVGNAIMSYLVKFAVTQLIKLAITKVFGDNPVTNFIGAMIGAYVAGGFSVDAAGNVAVDFTSLTDFSYDAFVESWKWTDTSALILKVIDFGGMVVNYRTAQGLEDIEQQMAAEEQQYNERLLDLSNKEATLRRLQEDTFGRVKNGVKIASLLVNTTVRALPSPMLAENVFVANNELHASIHNIDTQYDAFFAGKMETPTGFGYA